MKVWNASVDKDDTAFQRVSNSVSPWDGRKESNISFLMERHASKINGLGTGGKVNIIGSTRSSECM